MNKHIISFASIVLGGIILLAGCQKDGTTSKAGSLVKFTAGLKPAATRTSYSGEIVNNFERINWKDGETIVVWSDKAVDRYNTSANYASYAISSPKASGVNSTASLGNIKGENGEGGNGLVWVDGVETYKFWGSSPAISGTPVDSMASFTIPAEQMKSGAKADTATVDAVTTVTLPADMSNAWMFACVKGVKSGSKNVQLDFYPAFTAFELTFEGDADYKGKIIVTQVDLISDSPLAGSVEATLKPWTRENDVTNGTETKTHVIGASTYACTAAGESPYTLSYTLPEGSVVSAKDRIVLTVFALPQNVAGLKLRFHVTIGEEKTTFTGTLSKGGESITFGACEKHRIKGVAVPGNLWKIFYAPDILDVDQWEEVDGGSIILE